MNSSHYQVVYDFLQDGIGSGLTTLAAIILGGLLISLVGRAIAIKSENENAGAVSRSLKYFMIAWLFIGACAGSTMGYIYLSNVASIQQGHTEVVEGVVQDFVAGDDFCREDEQFTVQNVTFKYSCGVVGGFNQTVKRGGPIRDGMQVRVTYYGRYILKLEIAQ